MLTCWTCGSPVSSISYTCPACAVVPALQTLRNQIASEPNYGAMDPTRLAQLQLSALGQLQSTVHQGLSRISSVLQWGLRDVAWRLRQQTDALRDIDKTLKTPSETQANEFRMMADELANRGVDDEAEEFYRKALALNRLDYRVYVGLADALLRRNSFPEAKEVLERSLAHAPKATPQADASQVETITDWRSYSLRLIARVHVCQGDLNGAESALKQAVDLSPAYAEAHFDRAQGAAQARNAEVCTTSLHRAIELNSVYWYLSAEQPAFDSLRTKVNEVRAEARQGANQRVAERIAECARNLDAVTAKVTATLCELDKDRSAALWKGSLGKWQRRLWAESKVTKSDFAEVVSAHQADDYRFLAFEASTRLDGVSEKTQKLAALADDAEAVRQRTKDANRLAWGLCVGVPVVLGPIILVSLIWHLATRP